MKDISELRQKLDDINKQLLDLVNRRLMIANDVLNVKSNSNQPAYSPERESEMIRNLIEINDGPISEESIEELFKLIFSLSIKHKTI